MIRKIWSSDSRFKAFEFNEGLNIILAEPASGSTHKDSRNGVGKTTLLNIIHFCLGADATKIELPKSELDGCRFYIELELNKISVTASREISRPSIIRLHSNYTSLPISPSKDSDGFFYKIDTWKDVLGICLFGLRKFTEVKTSPTFRALFSYLARNGSAAYLEPFSHTKQQTSVQIQICNAYLLGMCWEHASQFGEIKDKSEKLKSLKNALKPIGSNLGVLEAERIRIANDIETDSAAIASYKVHPQYKEIQERANSLTSEIHDLSNNLIMLRRKLESYNKSIHEQEKIDETSVDRLFEEAGVVFPESVKKTLSEAKEFHHNIIKNRKLFLETEITCLNNEISSCEATISNKTNERAELLEILNTHNALDEFREHQTRLQQKTLKLEELKSQIAKLHEIDEISKELKASKIELGSKLKRDYEQTRPEWEKAVRLFNENSQALYSQPGDLIINTTDDGYKFDVVIQKSGSDGVKKMKIFCYDLMLVELMSDKKLIDFLYHDSNIFDGVDSRQIANALVLAAQKSTEHGFQYICAINSDVVPRDELPNNFDFDSFVVRTLKDKPIEESTLGFKFEITKTGK